jgi:hypothetical protein
MVHNLQGHLIVLDVGTSLNVVGDNHSHVGGATVEAMGSRQDMRAIQNGSSTHSPVVDVQKHLVGKTLARS